MSKIGIIVVVAVVALIVLMREDGTDARPGASSSLPWWALPPPAPDYTAVPSSPAGGSRPPNAGDVIIELIKQGGQAATAAINRR